MLEMMRKFYKKIFNNCKVQKLKNEVKDIKIEFEEVKVKLEEMKIKLDQMQKSNDNTIKNCNVVDDHNNNAIDNRLYFVQEEHIYEEIKEEDIVEKSVYENVKAINAADLQHELVNNKFAINAAKI